MKIMAIAASFLFVTGAAYAQSGGMPVTTAGGTCIPTRDIDHTHVVDASTVQFVLKNGTVWQNALAAPCPGLKFHGFTFVTHGADEVCSDGQGIRVLVTQQVCQLGAFTAMPAAAH